MSILIGHASISENATINGTKGDQTGGEVCTRTFYSKPWDFVAVHPDAAVREKHAKAIEAACANDNIGYGQSDRNTLNTLAKAVSYDLSKVGKCNCDCSSLQNVAAVASGASGATYGSNGWTTSTMKTALQKLGYKIITDAAYRANEAYCVRGAIYVKAASHTVCALGNGANYKKTLEKAGISESPASMSSGSTAYNVGDVVSFNGTKHYTSAAAASGKATKPGPAKVTAISAGAKHPYHVIHTDSTSNVYGWVDATDIGASTSGSSSSFNVGDSVSFTGDKHYTSSYTGATGKSAKPCKTKITAMNKSGAYPYHVVGDTVYGWVKASDISK